MEGAGMVEPRSISRTRISACALGAASLLACETTVVSTVEVGDVTVFPSSMTLATGDTATVWALVTESGGGQLAGMAVTWRVDDPTIAMVDANGLVEARAAGTTIVRATSGGVSGAAQVRVLGGEDPDSCEIADQTFLDDLEIPKDMTCVLTNVRVHGHLELREGARLVATGLIVGEHLKSNGGLDLVLADSWVGGDLVLERGGSVTIGGTRVAKKLEIKSNLGTIALSDSEIEETIKLEDNRGGPFTLLRNTSQRLECKDNEPAPTGAGNVAQGTGQCRGL
jgi:hypothetical protein